VQTNGPDGLMPVARRVATLRALSFPDFPPAAWTTWMGSCPRGTLTRGTTTGSPSADMASVRRSESAQAMNPGIQASPSGISRGKSKPKKLQDPGNLFVTGGVKATTKDQRPRGGVARHSGAIWLPR